MFRTLPALAISLTALTAAVAAPPARDVATAQRKMESAKTAASAARAQHKLSTLELRVVKSREAARKAVLKYARAAWVVACVYERTGPDEASPMLVEDALPICEAEVPDDPTDEIVPPGRAPAPSPRA
jgi:hypothetical protein